MPIFFYLPICSSVLKSGSLCFFLYLIVFYEPPNIHNLALVGLYSMMFAFLLSLNFNIWQFATKHICYSNIYTTYIAILCNVTAKEWYQIKKQTTAKQKQNKKFPTEWFRGGSESYHKIWHGKICTRICSLRDVTVQLKKRRASDTFSDYWRHGTHCLLFQVYLFFFL